MCFWLSISASAVPQKCFPSRCLYDSIPCFIWVLIHLSPPQRVFPDLSIQNSSPPHPISSLSCLFLHNICYLLTYHILVYLASPEGMAAPLEQGFLSVGFIAIYSAPWMVPGPLCLKAGQLHTEIQTAKSSAHNQARTTSLFSSTPSLASLLPSWEFSEKVPTINQV